MNLYNLHISPESLLLFKEADEYVLEVFWDKYRNKPGELRKRERAISVDARYAYNYVLNILTRPFPAGEAAIASDAYCAYCYAKDILRGPFPKGEEAISKNAHRAYYYAQDVLKGPFPAGEEAISKDIYLAGYYAKDVLKADFYYDGKLIVKFKNEPI